LRAIAAPMIPVPRTATFVSSSISPPVSELSVLTILHDSADTG
jgi:hypothetical protein